MTCPQILDSFVRSAHFSILINPDKPTSDHKCRTHSLMHILQVYA